MVLCRFLKKSFWLEDPLVLFFFLIVMLCWSNFSLAADKQLSTNTLNTVVVTATKTPHTQKDVPIPTNVITKEDIEKNECAELNGST